MRPVVPRFAVLGARARLLRAVLLVAVFLLPGAARAETLFEALGGREGLVRLIDGMVDRAVADPRIKAAFEETSIPRLKSLAVEHLCQVTDGGCVYTGRDMRKAHAALNLSVRDFDALAEDLQDTMDALGIAAPVQNRLIARLAPMQRDIVTR